MKRNISLPALVLLIAACNTTHKPVTVPTAFETKQLISIMQNPQSLSKESIAKIAGTDASEINAYSEDLAPDISKRTVLFSWQNGKKKSIKTSEGKELQVEGYSSLGLGFITKISKAGFQQKYESKTAVQEEMDRITQDETIDADIAIAEARDLAENARARQFEKLDHVGELSYWETPVNALHIYAKGICFTVTTNFDDGKTSKEKAIELAQLVFNNNP